MSTRLKTYSIIRVSFKSWSFLCYWVATVFAAAARPLATLLRKAPRYMRRAIRHLRRGRIFAAEVTMPDRACPGWGRLDASDTSRSTAAAHRASTFHCTCSIRSCHLPVVKCLYCTILRGGAMFKRSYFLLRRSACGYCRRRR